MVQMISALKVLSAYRAAGAHTLRPWSKWHRINKRPEDRGHPAHQAGQTVGQEGRSSCRINIEESDRDDEDDQKPPP
jgi:hypothetical protein